MAVPKRRMSRSNTHSRRSQWKTSAPNLAPCSNRACRALKPPHLACPTCGQYDGRPVVTPA
ncbi:MAG: large subunit ribosomal protein [Pseudonocardiales bacterium]|uniref:50S ribosomal protein L32 n=1 Tax=Pseudonocardia sp. Cha107L01 TaxID=3457576 RepID=UPI0028C51235|nr:ribosomal protein [Pseudonocardia sp.]MDT7565235.1 large subunit ribosomal protein [Pseudonocardiales bacterium]MDT7586284.1 large subunit ribosomal protein [Pseudonocardiales bacterium]MDT7599237.1 large subunit ribosomal protein [Pseudonocardiales bacterium]MDT7619248.1 large subunit ribosomal protein [Pseudonocardiales bacterium]